MQEQKKSPPKVPLTLRIRLFDTQIYVDYLTIPLVLPYMFQRISANEDLDMGGITGVGIGRYSKSCS
jgi:hypothetical protein